MLPFLLVSLLGLGVAFIPNGGERNWPYLGIALGDLCLIAVLWLVLSGRRLPFFASPTMLGFALGGIALVLLGDGHPAWDLVALVLLPVVYTASYSTYVDVTAAIAGSVAVIAAVGVVDNVDPELIVRIGALWAGVLAIAGIGAHMLVARLRNSVASREEAIRQSAMLGFAADELHSARDVDAVMNVAVTAAAHLIGRVPGRTRRAHLAYAHEGTIKVLAEYADDGEATFGTEPITIANREAFDALTGPQHPACISVAELPADSRIRDVLSADNVQFLAWVPLRLDEDGRTLLMVPAPDRPFDAGQLERLGTLGSIVQLAMRNALTREQLEAMTASDALTGVTNQREWERRMDAIPRGTRYAVLSLDVDQLKATNDAHGHDAGDRLLKSVAAALTKTVRRQDIIARVGEDAFATLLLGSRRADAVNVAKRVIKNLVPITEGVTARVSIGVAAGLADSDPKPVIAAADEAMEAAKRAGGGAVVVSTTPEPDDAGAYTSGDAVTSRTRRRPQPVTSN